MINKLKKNIKDNMMNQMKKNLIVFQNLMKLKKLI